MGLLFQLQRQIQQNSVPEFPGIETIFYKCGLIILKSIFVEKKFLCGISQRHFQGKISSQKFLFIQRQLMNGFPENSSRSSGDTEERTISRVRSSKTA